MSCITDVNPERQFSKFVHTHTTPWIPGVKISQVESWSCTTYAQIFRVTSNLSFHFYIRRGLQVYIPLLVCVESTVSPCSKFMESEVDASLPRCILLLCIMLFHLAGHSSWSCYIILVIISRFESYYEHCTCRRWFISAQKAHPYEPEILYATMKCKQVMPPMYLGIMHVMHKCKWQLLQHTLITKLIYPYLSRSPWLSEPTSVWKWAYSR